MSGSGYDYVVARDAFGKVAMCMTTDPMNIQVLATVNSASSIMATIDNTGTCTSVAVTTSSRLM